MLQCNRQFATLSGPSMIILRRVRAPRSGFDEYQHIIGFVYLGMQEIEIQPHEPLGSKYSCSFPMVIFEQTTYTFFTID